jgi:hypothetical protein
LWTRGGSLIEYFPDRVVAHDITLEHNQIESNTIGLHAYTGDSTPDHTCHHFQVRGNHFHDNRIGAQFGRVRDCLVADNQFNQQVAAAIQLSSTAQVAIAADNQFADNRIDIQQ